MNKRHIFWLNDGNILLLSINRLSVVVAEDSEVVVKEHLHIYIDIYSNVVMPGRFYAQKMLPTNHNLGVVNKEEHEYKYAEWCVDHHENVHLEEGEWDHTAHERNRQEEKQNGSSHSKVYVSLEGVPR